MQVPLTAQTARPGGGYHTSAEAVRATLDSAPWSGGTRRAVVVLMANDTAWSSASTKHNLMGPAAVTYIEYTDGAIDTLVR